MSSANGKYYMDMCEGPLFSKILRFAIPFFLSQLLQLMFNAADTIVLGRYAGHQAMAAVGCTSSLTHLLIALMIGLTTGTNVLAANFYGAKDHGNLSKTTHTAMMLSIVIGVLMLLVGWFFSRPLLTWMSTPEDVIDLSVKYMRIYFGGMIFLAPYNFGSAVLRALGDTKRPLYFLLFAGTVNVVLNVLFVTRFHMDVDGVAWATVASEAISCILVGNVLMRASDSSRLVWSKLRIHGGILRKMLGIGCPAGLQSSCYSLANTLIQSSINSFGDFCMAGNAAAVSMEAMINIGGGSFAQASMSFCAQNYGAKKRDRIIKSIIICIILAVGFDEIVGLTGWFFGAPLLRIYNSNPDVVAWGVRRMAMVYTLYGFCGLMDCLGWSMRGLGKTMLSTAITLGGVFVYRILWVLVVFPRYHSYEVLMMAYPISWIITAGISAVVLFYLCKRLFVQPSHPHDVTA